MWCDLDKIEIRNPESEPIPTEGSVLLLRKLSRYDSAERKVKGTEERRRTPKIKTVCLESHELEAGGSLLVWNRSHGSKTSHVLESSIEKFVFV
jgi:hypothetical protein